MYQRSVYAALVFQRWTLSNNHEMYSNIEFDSKD